MTSADSLLTLEMDQDAVVAYLDDFDGVLILDAEPGTYWLVLHPKSAPAETYYARVAWRQYPDGPPSVRFHDQIHGRFDVPSAWPIVPGYRLGAWDICKPITAEAYVVHPEWCAGPHQWSSTGNPFLWIAQTLQDDLNHNYQGRNT